MRNHAGGLLLAAGALLLLSAGIFLFMKLWFYAALLGTGAFGCATAALSFKN